MNRKDVFEYCLFELLERHKQTVLKESMDKDFEQADSLEDAMAADFLRAMERLGVLKFDKEHKP